MSPTPRAALLLGAAALSALALPGVIAGFVALVVVAATLADAWASRCVPGFARKVPAVLSRAVPAPLSITLESGSPESVRLRQPSPVDVTVEPSESDGDLEATVTARRRGRHSLPAVALRHEGPLGLGVCYRRGVEETELLVYPDLPAARRLALLVRQGRFPESGRRPRGPLGLGTEFESVRDYSPDDDFRQINWAATARTGRAMSNQFRLEQDRDVLCALDLGRLMGAPLGEASRLDAAVDSVTAVALVADELGDRCGVLAFDDDVRRDLGTRRKGARAVVDAIFDLEPSTADSDYELAFRRLESMKRAFVLVLTDLLDESAARSLIDALPVLARKHSVAIASSTDTDLQSILERAPSVPADVYETAVALEVLEARRRAAAQLRAAGANVIEAAPRSLGAACVGAYLRAKRRARL
ncbi:MAG: DUF58 domain-containing protein [Actinomycetota bacterium]